MEKRERRKRHDRSPFTNDSVQIGLKKSAMKVGEREGGEMLISAHAICPFDWRVIGETCRPLTLVADWMCHFMPGVKHVFCLRDLHVVRWLISSNITVVTLVH